MIRRIVCAVRGHRYSKLKPHYAEYWPCLRCNEMTWVTR